MGQISKLYCDLCKAEYSRATYSKPGETGVIVLELQARKIEGNTILATQAFMCPACYGKMVTWIEAKTKAAADSWGIAPPTPVNVKMPTV